MSIGSIHLHSHAAYDAGHSASDLADRLRFERLADREVETRARLEAERRRVGPVTDTFEAPTAPGRKAEPASEIAHIGETPPERDDGRHAQAMGETGGYQVTIRGIRPTPAGALGAWLDQIG